MRVLAVDTSSALSSVALLDGSDLVLARSHHDPRRHVEEIGPLLEDVGSLVDPLDPLDALACGVGPGPYTGLRVGIAAALALGAAWAVPVVGVCSLDAVAACARARGHDEPLGVALDARRKEVYWAAYDVDGARIAGPRVGPASAIDDALRAGTWVGAGAVAYRAEFGLVDAADETAYPRAEWIARLAATALAAGGRVVADAVRLDAHGEDSGSTEQAVHGHVLLPPRPLYLRRPDVTIAGGAA